MNCFNFPMVENGSIISAAKGTAMSTFVDQLVLMQNKIKNTNSQGMLSMFLSNHDQNRSGGYFTTDNQRKMAASLYLLTPGTPVIYYGEEIGMLGSGDSPDDANRRLPMKWGDVWTCEISKDATYYINLYENTVDQQIRDENSLMRHYANVISIRNRYPAIARGTYSQIYCGKSYLGGFFVDYNNDDLIILHNTSATESVTIDLKTLDKLKGYSSFELLEFVGVNDATLNGTVLTIGTQTSVILK